MGVFAGLLTYVAAVAVLLGAVVFGLAALLTEPVGADKSAAAKAPAPQLVRAADRKNQASKAVDTKARAGSNAAQAAQSPPSPQNANAAEPAKKQARIAKPKKSRPKPRPSPGIEDGSALGFAGSPRPLGSPFFR